MSITIVLFAIGHYNILPFALEGFFFFVARVFVLSPARPIADKQMIVTAA